MRNLEAIFCLGLEVTPCVDITFHLEHTESLLASLRPLRLMRHDVEFDSLGQRAALPDRYNITLLHGEAGAAMSVDVLVALLKPTVLRNVMEVVSTYDNRALHLCRGNKTLQNLTTDRYIAGERALLIDVVPLDGSIRCLNPESNILHPTHGFHLLCADAALPGDEDGILSLVCPFVLYRVPSPHE